MWSHAVRNPVFALTALLAGLAPLSAGAQAVHAEGPAVGPIGLSVSLPPQPYIPGLPTGTLTVPPASAGCTVYLAWDNSKLAYTDFIVTGNLLPETISRAIVACGSQIYNPTISIHQDLYDESFYNHVASASWGPGVAYTAEADASSLADSVAVDGGNPEFADQFLVHETYSITLVSPQYFGPAPSGCWLTNAQTLNCDLYSGYLFVPGTTGGEQP